MHAMRAIMLETVFTLRRAPCAQHLAKLGAKPVRDALPLECALAPAQKAIATIPQSGIAFEGFASPQGPIVMRVDTTRSYCFLIISIV